MYIDMCMYMYVYIFDVDTCLPSISTLFIENIQPVSFIHMIHILDSIPYIYTYLCIVIYTFDVNT